jgi:hypothetical protein
VVYPEMSGRKVEVIVNGLKNIELKNDGAS